MALINGFQLNSLRGDIYGGITAGVVALPLALAFGVSSGAGAIAGLYGAIFVGFFAALFGGTSAQVSGPTGPMTVVMAAVFTEFVALDPLAGPAMAFSVVILSGLFQIGFGLMRLGRYITLVPFPVISGFMTGIGVIIIVLQLGPLLGHPAAAGVSASLQLLPQQLAQMDPASLLIGAMALAIVLLWPARLARVLPSTLAALIICTLTAMLFVSGSGDPASAGLAVIGTIPSGLPQLQLPRFDLAQTELVVRSALMLAALGAIDSLLTSLVADNMLKSQHNSDRELIGQGIGNMMAGLFGGLPGAGATMRTVVNIRAGGRSPVSGMLHALVLLAVVLGAAPLAEDVPLAVLAGILMKVGLDIIDWGYLRRAHHAPTFVSVLMLLVLGLTVFVDLIVAVGVGVFLANMYTVKRLSDLQLAAVHPILDDDDDLNEAERQMLLSAHGRLLLYRLNGPISFGAAKGIHTKLRSSRPHDALLLDLSGVPYIDVSTALVMEELILESRDNNRDLYLVGITPLVEDVLQRMKVLRHLNQQHICTNREQAIRSACQQLPP